ncbi:MAG: ATP-binding cassette domain-containing protein [Nocardioidaceae bacterium]
MELAVQLTGVTVRFGPVVALRGVDLRVEPGERVALLGASGAGKSTLLGLLNGSLLADEGLVRLLGHEPAALSPRRLRAVQRRIGSVHQRLGLIEQVRVVHNVNAGQLGRWGAWRALSSLVWPRDRRTAHAALARVGLGWALFERTERLSGGERQRVAIARLLVQDPDLTLADEPVASLDPARAVDVLRLLVDGSRQRTLVVSLHQPELARAHCTRAVGLRGGRVVFDVATVDLTEDRLAALYELA